MPVVTSLIEYIKDEYIPKKKVIPERIKKYVVLKCFETCCPICGETLVPYYTSKPRKIITLECDLYLKVKYMQCDNGNCFTCKSHIGMHNPELDRIVLTKHHYAFDVTLLIGYLAYQDHKTELQIVTYLLEEHGIIISQPNVNHHKKIALAISEATLISNTKKVKMQLDKLPKRVYVLDGTSSNRSKTLFIIRELITGTVLGVSILTKHDEDTIKEFMENIFNQFGRPDFLVGDGERGLLAAVRNHCQDIPYQYCHTHFFKNMGKALMEELFKSLNKSLKKTLFA